MVEAFLETAHTPLRELDVRMMNPLQMAYVGDAVHDLLVRTGLSMRGEQVGRMHKRATKLVNAAGQTRFFGHIEEKLTQEEAEIARRGRNAHAKHAAPKNADPADYSCATGLEALWGYLYLSGQNARLCELFAAGAAQIKD